MAAQSPHNSSDSNSNTKEDSAQPEQAPHPGSQRMPRWEVGELIDAPTFGWRRLSMFIGPGLLMGASAIGGGEWLTGPVNTARYGGALLWLATISILSQVLYNIEISRYTLYTGEPIFTGKFRSLPGPALWLPMYLLLDLGSFLPYLASNAAIPFAAVLQGKLPDPVADATLLKVLATVVFVSSLVPLLFGGKIYNSLKLIMSLKLVIVLGFLMFLAVFYSNFETWREIITGFFRFGTVPVQTAATVASESAPAGYAPVKNLFWSLWSGEGFPTIDMTMIGFVAAMAAISGNGGLSNTPISNYTRDQGWGMGAHVGAIPSIFGRHRISLSHVGKIFLLNAESLRRWKQWYWHVAREQLIVWMPACFIGLALPSMLSVQFLPAGQQLANKWLAAGMTADGVAEAVGAPWADLFWHLTLFCGFLVLMTAMIATADGVLRRWIDVFWTASRRLQTWGPDEIGRLYFQVLCVYGALGLAMLWFLNGDRLLVWSTNLYNYALGFSCFHTVAINTFLLPKPLRPGWFPCLGLCLGGTFFTFIAVLTTIDSLGLW